MRRKRIMKGTAIGLTALMVMSGAVNPALAGEAATESTSEVHFPDVYTEDLIVPDTNADEVEAKVKALVNAMTEEEKFSFLEVQAWAMLQMPEIFRECRGLEFRKC